MNFDFELTASMMCADYGHLEKERLDNDYCFVTDPLDGTKEFIKPAKCCITERIP